MPEDNNLLDHEFESMRLDYFRRIQKRDERAYNFQQLLAKIIHMKNHVFLGCCLCSFCLGYLFGCFSK